jgi:hypothetical protein
MQGSGHYPKCMTYLVKSDRFLPAKTRWLFVLLSTVLIPLLPASAHAALTLDANVSRHQSTATITTPVTGVSGAGLSWVLVQRTNVQSGTSEIWRAFATSARSNVTVTATISQSVSCSLTVLSFAGVDTTGINGSGAIGGRPLRWLTPEPFLILLRCRMGTSWL